MTTTTTQTQALSKTILGSSRAWWKESSVYQIYPASFKDSNGDGIGDIPGIVSKLDYLKALGVDIVWLSPILQSPQVDMGYDISDYYAIHPPYGTMKDVDELVAGLHARGMKYVMDLVVNHTSDQHEWFKQSRSSKTNEFRDWYIWRKPCYTTDGVRQPPNNWGSYFSGSAWTYDEATDEYYLHLFATEQPDLNWENPKVRAAVHKIMRYWLDKGASGFRLDVINFISKDQRFLDVPIVEPAKPYPEGAKYYACGPRLHEYLQELGSILKEYNAFSVGEMPSVYDPQEILNAVGFERNELGMAFQFEIMDLDHGPAGKFTPGQLRLKELKSVVTKWQSFMYENNGWNALYLENHDQGRSISRFASEKPEFRALSGKMLATFLGLQSGTPFVYQGQEIGMVNLPHSWRIGDFRDLEAINFWNELTQAFPGDEKLQEQTIKELRLKSRDNGRLPMQWGPGEFAEFSPGTAQPWIGVNDDYEKWNAAAQVDDSGSVFNYWANILKLRKEYVDVFVYGSFTLVDKDHEELFVYTRGFGGATAVVVNNFSEKEVKWTVPAELSSVVKGGHFLTGNYEDRQSVGVDGDVIVVKPYEALVVLNKGAKNAI
ncbi:glycoside hydrolase superfamily [Aspergillus pseudoustus]|uniref:Glycoside hydrolase superfamily n=1 Tax=Aspergillus pseudoustus TaxID=1810923 RepID=A0ABR4JKH7_9EURO